MARPEVKEVSFAKRFLEAMPDGRGAVMIDGKMQDDDAWKQAKVIVDLARTLAKRDPDLDLGPAPGSLQLIVVFPMQNRSP